MNDIRFDGRVAIVTGAGIGIGRRHALLLAARGAQVVVNDPGGTVHGSGSDMRVANQVVDEISALGGIALANHESVASAEGAEAIVSAAMDSFGRVDVVINNAGIVRDRSFAEMDVEDWDTVIGVHLRGAMFVTRAAWPHMTNQAYGRIITTSSSAVFGSAGQTNYGAAKAGLIGLTRVLALEGATYNIKANVIVPVGSTRMTEGVRLSGSGQEHLPGWEELFSPHFISPVVAFLASEECQLSGEILTAGGGRVARLFIASTPGIVDRELSIETVRDRINEILSEPGYSIPTSAAADVGWFMENLQS